MAGQFVSLPQQVVALSPGAVLTGPNQRAQSASGPLATTSDSVIFSDGGTGSWIPAPGRVQASGATLVDASSSGTSVHPKGSSSVPGVISVVGGEPRVGGR